MRTMEFVKTPNLPKKPVSVMIYGEKYEKILSPKLHKLSITSVCFSDYEKLPFQISGHIDMQCCHLGENRIALPMERLYEAQIKLHDINCSFISGNNLQNSGYPTHIAYNILICDMFCFGKEQYVDEKIRQELINAKLKLIDVHQGYAKCAACVVDESSIITADSSLYSAAKSCGIDVLYIRPGYITLDGYDYGFIGGASVKLSKNLIAFTGSLDNHPDKDKILDFLKSKKIEIEYLTNKNIFDVGSLIPLCEYN